MKFEAGQTYTTRSICDSECVISVTVIKRTAKTITTKIMGNVKTLRIFDRDGAEAVRPWGRYSMAPTVTALKVAA
jgi:hypothetical protein